MQEVLQKMDEGHQNLQSIFSMAEEQSQGSYWAYLNKFMGGIIATVIGVISLTAVWVTAMWLCVKYRNIDKMLRQEDQRSETPPLETDVVRDLKRRVESLEKNQNRSEGEIRDLRRLGLSITDNALRFNNQEEERQTQGRNLEGYGEFRTTAFQPNRIRSLLGPPGGRDRPY